MAAKAKIDREKIKEFVKKKYEKKFFVKPSVKIHNGKRNRTIKVVTRDALWQDGKITYNGWKFLEELADFVQCRYYMRTEDPEEMKQRLIIKGAEQIAEYEEKCKKEPGFFVRNWRNYVFTGMRNTASNYQYHLNRETSLKDVLEKTEFLRKQENHFRARKNVEDDKKDIPESKKSNIKKKILEVFEDVLDERFNELLQTAFDFCDNPIESVVNNSEISEKEIEILRKVFVLSTWREI